ncbi:hypothetical protein CANARDRAFT_184468, partial [[Candida] arabinofermentans NRRL YB-2248]
HNQQEITETLRKAKQGQTLSPEKMNNGYNYLSLKSQPTKSDDNDKENSMSTPLTENSLFSTKKGVSESFVNSQPGLKMSTTSNGQLNAVKGAYNVFDKKINGKLTSRSPSDLLRRKRRRSETTSPNKNTQSNELIKEDIPNDDTVTEKQPTSSIYKFVNELLMNPQSVNNLTFIVQILINAVLFLILLTGVLFSFMAVKRDADRKIQGYSNAVQQEINSCQRDYIRNNCLPELRVPALEASCTEWENCMNKDPESVITTVAYFEILADCLNAFFHKLSFRTLFGMISLVVSSFIIPNVLFNKFRSSKTTTTNNYYNFTNESPNSPTHTTNQSTFILASESPIRSPKRMLDSTIYFTPPNPSTSPTKDPYMITASKDSMSSGTSGIGSSVRFNPNVSYRSVYEFEASPLGRFSKMEKY